MAGTLEGKIASYRRQLRDRPPEQTALRKGRTAGSAVKRRFLRSTLGNGLCLRYFLVIAWIIGSDNGIYIRGGKVQGVEFKGGGSIAADLVVIAAGIRPNVTLGERAGIEIKRGIVVNDYMETSHPDIFAVGECVQHNGICYGLVAPLLEQGKVLAATPYADLGIRYDNVVICEFLMADCVYPVLLDDLPV